VVVEPGVDPGTFRFRVSPYRSVCVCPSHGGTQQHELTRVARSGRGIFEGRAGLSRDGSRSVGCSHAQAVQSKRLREIRDPVVDCDVDRVRAFTQEISRHVFDETVDGTRRWNDIAYRSKHGDDLENWATFADTTTADSAVMNLTANGNNVSGSNNSGIRFLANSRSTLNAKIQNNNIGTPDTGASGPSEPGIRVDSGTPIGTAVDTKVRLNISGNTTSGSTFSGTTFPGIGLRKQGTEATTNDFGIVGLSPSPATAAETESSVSTQNPASTSGTCGTGGAAIDQDRTSLAAPWESKGCPSTASGALDTRASPPVIRTATS
jgi:hypothetical protein